MIEFVRWLIRALVLVTSKLLKLHFPDERNWRIGAVVIKGRYYTLNPFNCTGVKMQFITRAFREAIDSPRPLYPGNGRGNQSENGAAPPDLATPGRYSISGGPPSEKNDFPSERRSESSSFDNLEPFYL